MKILAYLDWDIIKKTITLHDKDQEQRKKN